MSGIASNGNSKTYGNGNPFYVMRQTPGWAGGYGNGSSCPTQCGPVPPSECHFPAPPPPRVYCHPAAFTGTDGRDKHLLVNAYGMSRPHSGYY